MLTEEQYQALCRYRDTTVPVSGKPDDLTAYFLERNFIRIERTEYSVKSECEVFYLKTLWVLTEQGKLALAEFEEQVRKERTKEERNKADMKKQRSANRLEALAVGTVSAIIAGLFIYYWPSIASFLANLFQKLSPP